MSVAKLNTGVDLYYEIHGKGETVVLLQGTGFPCDVWREHPVSELKNQYQVLIFDPRGIGRSSKVEHFFTVYQLAADTVALLDHLKVDQAHIMGHSIGGRIGLAIAISNPGKVKSLFLASTGSGSPVRAGEDCISVPTHRLLVRLITRGLEEHVRYEIIDGNGYFTEDFRKNHRDVVTAFWKSAWEHHADLSTYMRYVIARHLFEITHQLESVKCPTWIICGDTDIGGGEPHLPQAYALKERIPHALLRVLPNKSHGFFWEDPKGTKDLLLEWLKKSAV